MDPDATLAQIRATAAALDSPDCPRDHKLILADDLIQLFAALDGWLSNGGFLPSGWER